MRARAFIISAVTVVCAITVAGCALNPLRRSEEGIAAWLEAQTPLGTSRESVVSYAEKKKWFNPRLQGSDGKTRGDYVRGEIGEYRTIFVTSVTVFWEFDSTSRLERIRVWKTVDAL
jgi:hypothetical protein